MSKSILLLFGFLTFLSFSCKKDQDIPDDIATLPPATMTGANTFGCLVNGEVWLPHTGSLWDEALNVKHDRGWIGCDQLHVSAYRIYTENVNIYQTMDMNVWCPVLGENKMTLSKRNYTDYEGCGNYDIDSLSPHILFITKLDTINFIASGRFEFTVINHDCPDTIRITEGRFDADSHL